MRSNLILYFFCHVIGESITEMTHPKLHLTYFNISGLGQPIRNACAIGKIELTETRIDYADWPNLKEGFPTKQLPIMEVDGQIFTQSSAMLRYVGSKAGLYHTGTLESFRIDEAMGMCEDLRMKITPIFFAKEDLELKATLFKSFLAETVPLLFGIFEEKIRQNGTYVTGKALTIGDLLIDTYYVNIKTILFPEAPKECIEQIERVYAEFPSLLRMSEQIASIPEVAGYRKKIEDAEMK